MQHMDKVLCAHTMTDQWQGFILKPVLKHRLSSETSKYSNPPKRSNTPYQSNLDLRTNLRILNHSSWQISIHIIRWISVNSIYQSNHKIWQLFHRAWNSVRFYFFDIHGQYLHIYSWHRCNCTVYNEFTILRLRCSWTYSSNLAFPHGSFG